MAMLSVSLDDIILGMLMLGVGVRDPECSGVDSGCSEMVGWMLALRMV